MEHADKRPVSFHMPGHKGASLYRRLGYGEFLDKFMDCDITEIPGADNLFQTEGILKRTQERYAGLYETDRSYMLINGTSGGIIAAILASVPAGGKLLMARNCHKSVFNALTLGNIAPVYLYPELIEEYGILGAVTPQEVQRAMEEEPQAAAVILPSPNYYGVCSDIRAIAKVVHRHGKILIVDQAHGAHLKWLGRGTGPVSAEEAGADIVINSIHKTLASFTQSAVLNLNSDRVDRYVLEDKLQAIQSTSPSYLLMASLDINADILEQQGTELMEQWQGNLRYFYEEVKRIPGIRVIDNLENFDYSKINIDTGLLGISASELENLLMERGVFAELTTGNILMLMTGIGNQRRDFDTLLHALRDIREKLGNRERDREPGKPGAAAGGNAGRAPEKKEIFAIPKAKQRLALERSEGKICASSIIPYPPGIPLICPGEKITAEDIRYIRSLRAGGEKVIGVNENGEVTVGA
nr:aminotransferase class I/II-fold pyridoxal phosphate-dependent enzyme [Anaerovorax odorimutans]